MDTKEAVSKLEKNQEKNQEKNIAEISYLRGYVKGLEERIKRLEQANQ